MDNRYHEYFDSIAPATGSDEFRKAVLRKAEAMESNKKRIDFKKPLIAVCAAVAALGVGVSAAGAAGLIDFDRFFKNVFTAGEELGDTLAAEVDDICISISDPDYDLRLNAIIGDGKNMFGSLEIVRADGTPVTDRLMNEVSPTGMKAVEEWCGLLTENGVDKLNNTIRPRLDSGKITYTLNDAGNIDVHFEIEALNQLKDIPVVVMFKNLCCTDEEGNTYPVFPVDAWIDFTYTPTKTAQVTKNVVITEENRDMAHTLLFGTDDGSANLVSATVGCMSAVFEVEYTLTDGGYAYTKTFHEIKLIKDDGTEIDITPRQASMVDLNYINSVKTAYSTFNLLYMNEDEIRTAVDITEISAISIDGIVFELV